MTPKTPKFRIGDRVACLTFGGEVVVGTIVALPRLQPADVERDGPDGIPRSGIIGLYCLWPEAQPVDPVTGHPTYHAVAEECLRPLERLDEEQFSCGRVNEMTQRGVDLQFKKEAPMTTSGWQLNRRKQVNDD
jgi:hypothetical protein